MASSPSISSCQSIDCLSASTHWGPSFQENRLEDRPHPNCSIWTGFLLLGFFFLLLTCVFVFVYYLLVYLIFKIILLYIFICLFMMSMDMPVPQHMFRGTGVLSLFHLVCPETWTQVVRFDGMCLYPLSNLYHLQYIHIYTRDILICVCVSLGGF